LDLATLASFVLFNGSYNTDSTGVGSAVGAFIACTTITLIIVTIYLTVRVYKYGEK